MYARGIEFGFVDVPVGNIKLSLVYEYEPELRFISIGSHISLFALLGQLLRHLIKTPNGCEWAYSLSGLLTVYLTVPVV